MTRKKVRIRAVSPPRTEKCYICKHRNISPHLREMVSCTECAKLVCIMCYIPCPDCGDPLCLDCFYNY